MKVSEISIKKMTNNDINDILILEEKCFSDPWTRSMFEGELEHENVYYFLAEHNERIIGFVGFWDIIGECHITNICITPSMQNGGIGTFLMEYLIKFCKNKSINAATLEVRSSNTQAINFYLKLGFRNEGIRKNYYTRPSEDAVIMWINF
ncbi:MAG TPA: ribosomal-protein-alanine N-acetyltransferase [Clostridiales bacterium]|nr:MAG: ribosomal-protein-alanine N-acetyltransferase [Clostridiales bacterium GWD2_32_19]HCC08099.1 ribosomal-protein-alanine N-acetyltransferase [Clostridiales bacterium]